MKHNILPTIFTTGVPNASIFYEKHFFSSSLLHFMQGRKRSQWVEKALKSHMKIENITSVHNYSMLHITCSTKSQTTLCPSVPDMPINWKGQMYWDSYFRGSLHTRLRQSLLVFKVNSKWNALVIMGVPACPRCDAHYGLIFVIFSFISFVTLNHTLLFFFVVVVVVFLSFFFNFLYYSIFTVLIQCTYS